MNFTAGYMERIRGLSYCEVGTGPSSDPTGSVTPTSTVVGAYTVQVVPTIEWVDDPAIPGSHDYKRVSLVASARRVGDRREADHARSREHRLKHWGPLMFAPTRHAVGHSSHSDTESHSIGFGMGGDAGISLAELLVVVTLLGFVLAAAFALQSVVRASTAVGVTIAEGATTLGDPVEFTSRIVMQTRSVVTSGTVRAPNGATVTVPSAVASQPGDFDLAVATDRVPFNGWWELNYFHIDASAPSVLSWDCWTYDESNNALSSKRAYWKMSTSVNNRTVGLPMLDFYGKDTAVRLTTPLDITSDLRYVNVSLAVPTPGGGWTKDSRFVALRN